jgi:uncharacterized surface protein with fasciclin (FAS1) repeats
MKLRNNRGATFAAVGVALTLSLSACGGEQETTEAAPKAKATASPDVTASESPDAAMASGQQFGAGCAAVPADGEGSFAGMADDPVATAASNNPELSTLVTAVKSAGLVDTLNGAQDITVFAPANSAFAALDKATMDAAMAAPKGLLTKVLTLHVVPGKKSPEQLAGTFETLNGEKIIVKGSGEDFTVGDKGAKVVCGNVQTANATVYIIDQVLLPQGG